MEAKFPELISETLHVEGRRGFRAGDKAPKRQFFPSSEAAHESMADSPVAYNLHHYADGKAGLCILSEYVVIERTKKTAPWRDTEKRLLASCAADASEKFENTDLCRAVHNSEWITIQTAQHLRALGIKSR